MQEVKVYIVILSLIWAWIDSMFSIVNKKVGYRYVPRSPFFKLIGSTKPFNCGICLSFWTGIISTCITFNILFLTLPVSYKILNKFL